MVTPVPAALAAVFLVHAPALGDVPKQVETIRTEAGHLKVTEVAGGLVFPFRRSCRTG